MRGAERANSKNRELIGRAALILERDATNEYFRDTDHIHGDSFPRSMKDLKQIRYFRAEIHS